MHVRSERVAAFDGSGCLLWSACADGWCFVSLRRRVLLSCLTTTYTASRASETTTHYRTCAVPLCRSDRRKAGNCHTPVFNQNACRGHTVGFQILTHHATLSASAPLSKKAVPPLLRDLCFGACRAVRLGATSCDEHPCRFVPQHDKSKVQTLLRSTELRGRAKSKGPPSTTFMSGPGWSFAFGAPRTTRSVPSWSMTCTI